MKVQIVTRHAIANYGSILQSYATQKVLEKLGYDSEIINYIIEEEKSKNLVKTFAKNSSMANKNIIFKFAYILMQIPNLFLMESKFKKFRKKYLRKTEYEYSSNEELREKLPKADIYCTGSDQVWGNVGTIEYDPTYFLDFVPENKKCITYAASFGKEIIPESLKKDLPNLVKKYDKILMREDTGVELLNKYSNNKDSEQVLDPTLLLNKEEWDKLSEKIKVKKNSYIFVYQLHHNKFFDEYLKKISKETNLPIIRVNPSVYFKFKIGKFKYLPTPGQFITYIKNAKYVVTDSFHGTVFSLIYNKEFVDILPKKTYARIKSILKLVGLENRCIENIENNSWLNEKIDYERINNIIDNQRNKSIELLKKALEG